MARRRQLLKLLQLKRTFPSVNEADELNDFELQSAVNVQGAEALLAASVPASAVTECGFAAEVTSKQAKHE